MSTPDLPDASRPSPSTFAAARAATGVAAGAAAGSAGGGGGAPDHLLGEAFRASGHALVDWIAAYWERLREGDPALPVLAQVRPGEVLHGLAESAPAAGEAWERVWADVERVILPGITHWQSPGFFGYFPCSASGPAVLGELLSAGLGVNGMLWASSPAATELETRVLDWMARACALPGRFLSTARDAHGSLSGGGVIHGTASESAVVAMIAARHRARVQGRLRRGQQGVVYTSAQAHSSIAKGAVVTGIAEAVDDEQGVRLIACDEQWRMDPAALQRAIEEDLALGRVPLLVCATVGTTSTMAMDDVEAMGAIARRHGLWLHVDAAMAGGAWLCEEHRASARGLEQADSVCMNPHKWLLTNFDCDLLWTSDRASLTGALSVTPEYLRTGARERGEEHAIDYRDWQVPLGRRFRALKLWFVMRHYGVEGLAAHVRASVGHAATFEHLARDEKALEVLPRGGGLCLVCFRVRGERGVPEARARADARGRALLAGVNARGRVMLSHTVVTWPGEREGSYTLRLSTGGTFTTEAHVRLALDEVRAVLKEV